MGTYTNQMKQRAKIKTRLAAYKAAPAGSTDKHTAMLMLKRELIEAQEVVCLSINMNLVERFFGSDLEDTNNG